MSDTGREPAQKAGAAPGQRLREERERRGISTQKVAEDLHVDPWIVEALEAGQFQMLGAPVYAKGHLKKYAALLGLDTQTLVAECGERVQTPALSPLKVAPGTRGPSRFRVRPWLLGAAGVLVAVAAGWGFGEWRARSALSQGDKPVVSDEQSANYAGTKVEPQPSAAGSASAKPAQQAATQKPPEQLAALRTSMRLRLSFAADSWVEVYDAEGRRVLADTGVANSARSLTVTAPARLALGNPRGVTIEVNGRPVSMPKSRGGVLHMTIDAQGHAQSTARPARR